MIGYSPLDSSAPTPETPTLFLFQHAPLGQRSARDGIEATLAFAAFEQPIAVLFIGDGVWQLLPDQGNPSKGNRSHSKLLAALAMYDVNDVYSCSLSIEQRGIDPEHLCIPTKPLNQNQVTQLIHKHQPVLSF